MNTAEWMSKRSGEETIVGMSAGEAEAGDPRRRASTITRKSGRAIAPHELFNLPEGHGLVWAAGQALRNRSTPRPIGRSPVAGNGRGQIRTICKRGLAANPTLETAQLRSSPHSSTVIPRAATKLIPSELHRTY